VVQTADNFSLSSIGAVDDSYNLVFGGDGSNLAGLIDDVRIYDRALSASEISALYNATK